MVTKIPKTKTWELVKSQFLGTLKEKIIITSSKLKKNSALGPNMWDCKSNIQL